MTYELALKYARRSSSANPWPTSGDPARLADMTTEIEAARHLIYYCAWQFSRRVPGEGDSMAKLFSAQMAARGPDAAPDSRGLRRDGIPVQRYWRTFA
jgi:alkylation response protein AidB-like acyl-CoA dehydrogenase